MKIFLFRFSKEINLAGKPFLSRVTAFKNYFLSTGIKIEDIDKPSNALHVIKLILFPVKIKGHYFFISMPPFRNFWLFFIPGLKIILDIRDGWSIAQETGYGGNSKNKPFKAKISRIIERFAIRRSYLAITCTPGLQQYLAKVSGRKLLLIPNGINDEDIDLINQLKTHHQHDKNKNTLVFCCAGQFAEYGQDKVKKLLQVLADRYQDKELVIQLIGSNQEANSWVAEYFSQLTSDSGKVEILPRMDKKELFETMLKADYGLTIIRDPSYDLGTKVYDYIALGLPVVNYFVEPNSFTKYFDACLDVPFNKDAKVPEIRRSILIESVLDEHFARNTQ